MEIKENGEWNRFLTQCTWQRNQPMQESPINATKMILWNGQFNQLAPQVADHNSKEESRRRKFRFRKLAQSIDEFFDESWIFVGVTYHSGNFEYIEQPSNAEVPSERWEPQKRLQVTM